MTATERPETPEKTAKDAWEAERRGQAILPGFRRDVGAVPVDRRPWRAGDGQQINSPAFRGPEFLGKIIPPVLEADGSDVRRGSFQVMRDARGYLIVVDWKQPFDPRWAETLDDEVERPKTPPIMGRTVYRTRQGLLRARNAMAVLFVAARDRDRGLPPDPALCRDLVGKEIRIGQRVLGRFARGPNKDRFVLVDESAPLCERGRFELLAPRNLKGAVKVFVVRCKSSKPMTPSSGGKRTAVAGGGAPRRKLVGAPIAFDVPAGFGARAAQRGDRVAGPGSLAWQTSVAMFRRSGRWCKSAELVWGGRLPEGLVVEAEEARRKFLEVEGAEGAKGMEDADG